MENVPYLEFEGVQKNKNVLQTCTRDTITCTRNYAQSQFHSLVSVPCRFSRNVLETVVRQWISRFNHVRSMQEYACGERLLHILDFWHFKQQSTYSKNMLETCTRTAFRFAHAMPAFKMWLWPTCFRKTLTLALRFRSDCLDNTCETHRNVLISCGFLHFMWFHTGFVAESIRV